MSEINNKYDFPLDSYPIRKIRELYPITNDMIIVVSGIPISDAYANHLESGCNLSELCKHLKKDLLLGIEITSDKDYYDDEDNCEEEYDDEDSCYDEEDEEFDDNKLFEYLKSNNIDNDDDGYVTTQYQEGGFTYNFSKILPNYMSGTEEPTFPLYDNSSNDSVGIIYDKELSAEINHNIDTEGNCWMFTFSFRHPIGVYSDTQIPKIISKKTGDFADNICFSLMDILHDGIPNIVHTESMRLIIEAMKNIAVSGDRMPFIGTVGFNLNIGTLDKDLQYSYLRWTIDLYNSILEDYVEYESMITPPIIISSNDLYFKPNDFLGQYYMPNGITIRKEEKKNARRKESKKSINSKSKKASCKENNKKQSP